MDAFAAAPTLYIADAGRPAPLGRSKLRGAGERGEWDTFLAVAFPASQVNILPVQLGCGDGIWESSLRQRFSSRCAAAYVEGAGDASTTR